jgi:HD-GYP domain-containing protein (c-di-GMP phosphodiesterase class II)
MLSSVCKNFGLSKVQELGKFADRVNRFGFNFAVYNTDNELVLMRTAGRFESSQKELMQAGVDVLRQTSGQISPAAEVCRVGKNGQILVVVLKSAPTSNKQEQIFGVALIDVGVNRSEKEELLSELLALLAENFRLIAANEEQLEKVSTELAHVYEELVLLHKLSINMKVTEADANFLQMACDSLTEIVSVEGIAVLLEKNTDGEKQLALAAGSGLIDLDEQMTTVLHNRLLKEINGGREALLDSDVDSPFRYEWPSSIKNIIAVPLFGKGKNGQLSEAVGEDVRIIGIMVAINRVDKPDFDSTDVKLFNSVANGCAVFVENGRLFRDLKELFIGSLKALTSSIDAKDQYTRGHSERVAFIARWIAVKLAEKNLLKEEQIHKVYLAGLLHDIGKMGIDESVLRKKDKLTEQEFEQIKAHPSVGAGILSGIKQMSDIVPGVLYHHERVDGKGYPQGLNSTQIPLIGKIIGLADCFDAMTSKRTYRNALSVEQAVAEIEKGLGTQFDEKAGKAFIQSDIYQLWDILQEGFNQVYGNRDFSEYGTIAVGELVR